MSAIFPILSSRHPFQCFPISVCLMMKHSPATETHFKCYHCFNKALAWHPCSFFFLFFFPLSFFTLHLKEQCHVLSDHLTQSPERLSLLSDHLCLPLFFSVLVFFPHTKHIRLRGWVFMKKKYMIYP